MTEEEKNIEDLFRKRFSDYKVEPSQGLWNNIRWKLAAREFFSFSFSHFNVWYVLLGVGLLAGLIHSEIEISEPDPVVQIVDNTPEEVISDKVPVAIEQPVAAIDSGFVQSTESLSLDTNKYVSSPEEKVSGSSIAEPVFDRLTDTIDDFIYTSEKTSEEKDPIVAAVLFEEKASPTDIVAPVADFDFYPSQGCKNLSVRFINRSENAESFRWTFGDGGTSIEQNPIYFYDKSGYYTVTLEIIAADGSKDKTAGSIEIYHKPEAVFETSINETGHDRTVYFYNYSRNAESYIWDFGDGNQSIGANPIHTYIEQDNPSVSLIAISENGCTDTMVMKKIFSDEGNFIKFPNAFRPEVGGPADISYNSSEPVTKVFFPLYKGVAEYQLSIYNKSGLLLFETNDISTGWNGYYNNRLVSPGVYIWKARGRFENGEPFVKAGDVTVILNN